MGLRLAAFGRRSSAIIIKRLVSFAFKKKRISFSYKVVPVISFSCKIVPVVSFSCKIVPVISFSCKIVPVISFSCKIVPVISFSCKIVPVISFSCKMVPVQFRENESEVYYMHVTSNVGKRTVFSFVLIQCLVKKSSALIPGVNYSTFL